MLLLVAYDHFSSKFSIRAKTGGATYINKQGNRTVSIMRFGVFQIEEITMPATFEDLTTGRLSVDYHPTLKGSQEDDIPYQFNVWSVIRGLLDQRKRNRHSYNGENPGPPAILEVWHFALRLYLNLGFRSKTFWMPRRPLYIQSLWWKEVGRGDIFISPNWAPVQKYRPGVVSWDHETN
jgi:hypothetical protein